MIGRISHSSTEQPLSAACQAASLPARPPPITVTTSVISPSVKTTCLFFQQSIFYAKHHRFRLTEGSVLRLELAVERPANARPAREMAYDPRIIPVLWARFRVFRAILMEAASTILPSTLIEPDPAALASS